MCGIAGIVDFLNREPETSLLTGMMDQIVHRGPDDAGHWNEPGIGLGFRRLAVIDLEEGQQPITNEDETVRVVFNGEIYNYKALRSHLQDRGHTFKTQSDTEVIVHLYEEYGEDCVKHLRGMFGFAIWDRKERKLFAARDHFGIKPFYYYSDGARFLFGSEIKSILAVGVPRTVNKEALSNYMTFQYVPEPHTMFEGIYKLRPGHTLTVNMNGAMEIHRYWDPMFEPEDRPFDEYVEQIRETLKESVTLHMQSDVRRGCFLSSGIDSTSIATLMRQVEPIQTFSVGFEGPRNETFIARDTAKEIGTEHFDKIITEDDYFNCLPKAVWHLDEPVADPSAIALYHVAELASREVTVALSGEGADELFGGYRIYREPLSLRPIAWMPSLMKKILHRIANNLPSGMYGRNYLLRGTTSLEERFLGNAKIFSEDLKSEVLAMDRQQLSGMMNPVQIAEQFYNKTKHLDPVSRMQYIDLNLWMPGDILMKADKMTMAHSLEIRVPFLDKEMFEIARKIPAKYRISQGTTKYIFRKAMEGIIPDPILTRPKLGFPVPLRDWLKGKRGTELMEQIRGAGLTDYFNISQVEQMLAKHQAGQADYARHLWIVYMFSLWHDTYMQDSPAIMASSE